MLTTLCSPRIVASARVIIRAEQSTATTLNEDYEIVFVFGSQK